MVRPDAQDLRQLVHLLSGGGAFLLFFWPKWAIIVLLIAGTALAIGTQWVRQRRGAHVPLFRPGEALFSNGALTYAIGVGVTVMLVPSPSAFIGWIVLAVGDSFATLIGRRLPLLKITRLDKSIGGTLAFLISATIAVAVAQAWRSQLAAEDSIWFVAVTGAFLVVIPATIAELSSRWMDDNLTIPLVAGLAAWAWGIAA